MMLSWDKITTSQGAAAAAAAAAAEKRLHKQNVEAHANAEIPRVSKGQLGQRLKTNGGNLGTKGALLEDNAGLLPRHSTRQMRCHCPVAIDSIIALKGFHYTTRYPTSRTLGHTKACL
eukprot:1156630-Pelagomonas_calceolata.AAC.8